jgi:hypothetical protein
MRLAKPSVRPDQPDEVYANDLTSVYCNEKDYPSHFKGAARQALADALLHLFPTYPNEPIIGPSTKKGKGAIKGDVVTGIKFAANEAVEGAFFNLAQWTSGTLPPVVVRATQAKLAQMVRTKTYICML